MKSCPGECLDHVSCQGTCYRIDRAARLPDEAAEFCACAAEMFERRPPLAA